MTATQPTVLELLMAYGTAMCGAGLAPADSDIHDRQVTESGHLYAQLARILQAYNDIASAAIELENARHKAKNATYLDFCLWHALERLAVVLETDAPPPPELDDTQEIDVTAILAVLEEKPKMPRWKNPLW